MSTGTGEVFGLRCVTKIDEELVCRLANALQNFWTAPDRENAHGSSATCRANYVTFLRDGTLGAKPHLLRPPNRTAVSARRPIQPASLTRRYTARRNKRLGRQPLLDPGRSQLPHCPSVPKV